jgi:hypothetical protein
LYPLRWKSMLRIGPPLSPTPMSSHHDRHTAPSKNSRCVPRAATDTRLPAVSRPLRRHRRRGDHRRRALAVGRRDRRPMMTTERLPDWPPEAEPIGPERARAYVRWIAKHAPPLMVAASQLIKDQHHRLRAAHVVCVRGPAGDVDARRGNGRHSDRLHVGTHACGLLHDDRFADPPRRPPRAPTRPTHHLSLATHTGSQSNPRRRSVLRPVPRPGELSLDEALALFDL